MSDQQWPSAPGSDEGTGRPPQETPPPQPSSAGAPPPSSNPPPSSPPPGSPPPSAPPPPPPAPSSGGYGAPAGSGAGQPADLWIRFGARVIDSILLGIVNAIISAVIIFGIIFSDMSGGVGFNTFGFSVGSWIASLVLLAITLGYFVFLESSRGQTVGKMLLNLEVRSTGGGFPSPEQALKRNGFYVLNVVPFIGGLLQLVAVIYIAVTINQNPQHRGWHDELADTVVVRTQ